MNHNTVVRLLIAGHACLSLCNPAGCSRAQVAPAYTPEQVQAMHDQQVAAEMPLLNDLEREYGSDNSQVQQMKMELGLGADATKSAGQEAERVDTMTNRDSNEQAGRRPNYE